MHRIHRLYISLWIIIMLGCIYGNAQSFCRVHSFDIYDGLPANNISSVAQGDNSLIWVSTWNGLCFYDGYVFTTYGGNDDGAVLSTNRIISSKPLANGNVWVHTYDRNIYLLERSGGKFVDVGAAVAQITGQKFEARNIYVNDSLSWISGNGELRGVRVKNSIQFDTGDISVFSGSDCAFGAKRIRKVTMDQVGNEWIITDKGVQLYKNDISVAGDIVDVISIGDKSYLFNSDGDVYIYNKVGHKFTRHRLYDNGLKISVVSLYGDDRIVIGTSAGIGIYYPLTGKLEDIPFNADPNFIPEQLFIDTKGRIWLYSNIDGVFLFTPENKSVKHLQSNPEGLASVRSVRPIWHEDEYGTIWLVPVNGVFGAYDDVTGEIIPQPLISELKNFNLFPVLERCMSDNQGNLWLTSTHGLKLLKFRRHNMRTFQQIGNDEPRSLVQLPDCHIAVGTAEGYLLICDIEGNRKYVKIVGEGDGAKSYKLTVQPVRFSSKIYALFVDREKRMWVGTKGEGLYILDTAGNVRHFKYDASDAYSISDDQIYDIDEDNNGNIWIGTYGGGLNLAEVAGNGEVKFLNLNNVLKNYPDGDFSRVRRVTHDGKGIIYLSTAGGLITFSNRFSSPESIKYFINSHEANNLESIRTDNVMQTFVASDGKVYVATMGGGVQVVNGNANMLSSDLHFEPIKLTLGNNTDLIREPDGGSVWSIIEDRNNNICIVRETSIEVHSPSGGITVFGPDDMQANLKFSEAKPLMINGSDILMLSTLGGLVTINIGDITKSDYCPRIVFTGVRFQGDKTMRKLPDIERLDVEPEDRNLTLNFAALDYSNNYLLRYAYKFDSEPKWTYLHDNHAVHLNNLSPGKHWLIVKSTNGDGVWVENESVIELNVIPVFWETIWAKILYLAIIALLLCMGSYFYFMKRKNRLLNELREQENKFYSDVSHKLRTPLTLIDSPVSEVLRTENLSDTARNHLKRVKRNSSDMLSLVDSMLKKNCGEDVYISDLNVPASDMVTMPDTLSYLSSGDKDGGRERLLVVEDNDDLRSYLHDILSSQYDVVLAENGRSGLNKAEKLQPDFIITDVTMPEMDGLTMVHNIKQNKSLCHIPIIVLSAKASEQDRIDGLKEGIDDYITKPFSATYLRQRVANIIAQRRILQQAYLESLREKFTSPIGDMHDKNNPEPVSENEISDGGIGVEMPDDDRRMIDTLMEFMYSRLEDENLRIEDLAEAVGLGRTVFYGKIKSLLGVSPSDFLRRIRMQRAEQLISETSLTFSEIAFSVGFSDPKYFTKCFKKDTGLTPSEYRKKNQSLV